MAKDFLEAVKSRRSIYGISKEQVGTDNELKHLIEEALLHTPSAFNSQSARIVLLLGEQHDKLWEITTETLRAVVPADQFSSTEEKMGAFKAGYGTVLFFEDQSVIQGMQQQYVTYQDRFPTWSEQSSGMHQYVIWTALRLQGYGASLQHYNPLIDEQVSAEWDLPETWKLIAQMPFGKPTAEPGDKSFQSLEGRFKVFE
ncbi:nitroreductase family protein [Paenibacillus daejeonensis]|uniref:nitroreductase family protein n=1 Tax=Paenibacillus daejeonensis TaxID=135193 RepID=UPI0003818528|nr:nitroreductase family protein [Paenibacillus daejeonensis]